MSAEKPLISIVIPCYNAESFIKDTINSVLTQSYQNFEIIIINDGSTDQSLEIIKNISDARINIINKKNSGISDTRNIGLQQAEGKYVLFLDSDDIISPNYLKSGIELLENSTDVHFCTFHINHIDTNGKPLNLPTKRGVYKDIQKEIASFDAIAHPCPSAYIYKRVDLVKNNILFASNLKSPEDRHFLLQVGQRLSGVLIPETQANLFYRVRHDSLSNTLSKCLLLMQETFYWQTINDKLLPNELERIFSKKMAYQLIFTFVKLRDLKKVWKYSLIYLNSIAPIDAIDAPYYEAEIEVEQKFR